MAENDASASGGSGKGKTFFDRADQVALTGKWDFAIELYLEGIEREPENLERGHKPLRLVALKRTFQGGKGPGMMETLKYRSSKDPVQNLRNAEYLWAKQPGSVASMEQVLGAAMKLDLKDVAKWMCDILLEAQQKGKKDKRTLVLLYKTFDSLGDFRSAATACRMAVELSPNDQTLKDKLRDLETNTTIKAGGYDRKDGDFTAGIANKEKQKELIEKDKMVSGKGFLETQVQRARQDYELTPTVPGKINGLVDALLKLEDEVYENEAVDVLTKAHAETGAYQFKMRIGEVKMRQMKRRYQSLLASGDKPAALEFHKKQLEFELAEYAERAINYPTDMNIKYELGRRQLVAGKADDAIASLQQAQRDPRRHVMATILMGQAFSRKGWLREAGETYERILESDMAEDRRKELYYLLADVKEKIGRKDNNKEELAKAMDYFSRLAQMDFGFKDVRTRVENLRKDV